MIIGLNGPTLVKLITKYAPFCVIRHEEKTTLNSSKHIPYPGREANYVKSMKQFRGVGKWPKHGIFSA